MGAVEGGTSWPVAWILSHRRDLWRKSWSCWTASMMEEVNSKLASLAAAYSITNRTSGLTDLHRVSAEVKRDIDLGGGPGSIWNYSQGEGRYRGLRKSGQTCRTCKAGWHWFPWSRWSQMMYPATFLFKSRSVTSFACRALAPCTRMTRTNQLTGALNHGWRKQVPFAPCCFLGACGVRKNEWL